MDVYEVIKKRYSVKFSINNILNSLHKNTYTYNNIEYIYEKYSLGRTYSFGFVYFID